MSTFCRVYQFVSSGETASEIIWLDNKNIPGKFILSFLVKSYISAIKSPQNESHKILCLVAYKNHFLMVHFKEIETSVTFYC